MSTVIEISQHKGLLLFHSLALYKGSVAASLITQPQINQHNFYFLTDDKDAILANLANGSAFPPQIFLDPNNILHIQQVLASHSLLIIDSLNILLEKPNLLELVKNRNPESKIIILFSWGITQNDINNFPNYTVAKYSLATPWIPEIQVKLESTGMNAEQTNTYDIRRILEETMIAEGDAREKYLAENFNYSKQVTNFIYPRQIQAKLDQQIGKLDKVGILPDYDQSDDGWMTSEILKQLSYHSPKIRYLLTLVSLFSKDRHLIYTHYLNHHGVNLLSTLLSYLEIKHVVLTGDVRKGNRRDQKYQEFNDDQDIKVFLSSVVIDQPLANISHIHYLEGIRYQTFNDILQNCYNLRYITETYQSLLIHFHIANLANGQLAADGLLYNKLQNKLQPIWSDYNHYNQTALPIVYQANLGPIVQQK